MLNMIGSVFVGATMVGADRDVNAVDAGGGTAHGESQVHGSLSLANSPHAVITTRTTVTAVRLNAAYRLIPSTANGSTSVSGNAARSTLRGGLVATSTSMTGAMKLAFHLIASVPTRTTTSAVRLNANPLQLTVTVNTKTAVFSNLIKPAFLAATTIPMRTTVTGDEKTHILRGPITTRTTVVGQAVNKGNFTGVSTCRTTTTATTLKLLTLALRATVPTRTTPTGRLHDYPMDFVDVTIHTGTTPAAYLNLAMKVKVATVATRTSITAAVSGFFNLPAGAVNTRTSFTKANVTKPFFFSTGELITCSTTVASALSQHILRGSRIQTRTSFGATVMNLFGRPSGTVATRTTVSARPRLALLLQTTLGTSTAIRGRMHDYPTDFQDVFIRMRSTVTGKVGINTLITAATVSSIRGLSVVTGAIVNRLLLRTNGMTMRTTVTGKARYGFGADLALRTIPHGRLGIQTGINSWKGQTIAGRTTVTGSAPSNGFVGTSRCATALLVFLSRAGSAAGTAVGSTQFHSHFGGRHPYEGPMGSVNLIDVPHGDLGTPDEITCSTLPAADITVERQRVMVVFGNAGLSVDRTLVAHGNATAGTGIRSVGPPVGLEEKTHRQVTYYV